MARQLSVRNVPSELSRRLEALSKERGMSLNATVLTLLDEAVGVEGRLRRLARYATWTEEDLRAFEDALAAQRVVDSKLWR